MVKPRKGSQMNTYSKVKLKSSFDAIVQLVKALVVMFPAIFVTSRKWSIFVSDWLRN